MNYITSSGLILLRAVYSSIFGHKHQWKNFYRITPKEFKPTQTIFSMRKCDCGETEILSDHGRTWKPLDGDDWRYDWEREWFESSVRRTQPNG